MNHKNWTESYAAERYLLKEMEPAERDAFEQHFFECTECAEDVGTGVTFIEGAREVGVENRVVPMPAARSRVVAWISSVAASLLLFVVGYQNLLLIPRLKPAFAVAQSEEIPGPTRSDEKVPEFPVGTDRIVVPPIQTDPPHPQFEVELRNASGKRLGSDVLSAEKAEQQIEFRLPLLPAGSYQVVARGVRKDGNRSAPIIFEFRIRE